MLDEEEKRTLRELVRGEGLGLVFAVVVLILTPVLQWAGLGFLHFPLLIVYWLLGGDHVGAVLIFPVFFLVSALAGAIVGVSHGEISRFLAKRRDGRNKR